jgi:hypothetical protein
MAYLMEVLPNKGLKYICSCRVYIFRYNTGSVKYASCANIVQKIYGTKLFQDADIAAADKEIMAVCEFKREKKLIICCVSAVKKYKDITVIQKYG